MRTSTYKSVYEGLVRLTGGDPATVSADTAAKLMEFLNTALSDCHEYWRWPELLRTEGRYYRPTWTATSYASLAEVYYAAGDAYYRANAACILTDVPGTSAKWDAITEFARYIAFTQTGQTAIEAVIEAWDQDPRVYHDAVKLAYRLDADGARFAADADLPTQVWLEFRVRAPEYLYSALWTATTFAAGVTVYHAGAAETGELYLANASCSGTDVPGVSTKWTKLDLPYIFRHAAKMKAYALWLVQDAQTEKAKGFDHDDPDDPGQFQTALDEQVWQFTKLQGQTGRPYAVPLR